MRRQLNLFFNLLAGFFLAAALALFLKSLWQPPFPFSQLGAFVLTAFFFHLSASVLLEGLDGFGQRLKVARLDLVFLICRPRLWPLFLLSGWPYWLSRLGRSRLRASGSDRPDLLYGETPFSTWERIREMADIGSSDIIFDLGCGSGRVVIQTALAGIKSVGIELNPALARPAADLARLLRLRDCLIREGDFLAADLSSGTVFYLPATAWSQETLARLGRRLAELPAGRRVVCLTHKLTDPALRLVGQSILPFSWADEQVYFYKTG